METREGFIVDNVFPMPSTLLETLPGNNMDFNLMNELLDDGYCLNSTYGSDFWHLGLSNSSPSNYLPSLEINTNNFNPIPHQIKFEQGPIRSSNSGESPPFLCPQIEVLDHNWETILAAASPAQSNTFLIEDTEMSQKLWTELNENPCPITSSKKRLEQVFEYLKESTRGGDVLIQAVDLRSSKCLCPPKENVCDESYEAALAEIQEVLKSVSDLHKFPLAQTWAPCAQRGPNGSRNFDGSYAACISIVDSACYVPEEQFLGFHKACSEKPLLRGEGVAGGAFVTNKLCFATDITGFSEAEYPLSHHARVFRLRAAAAIRLRSVSTGSANFVLEFFLPLDCKDTEDQQRMLSSLSLAIQDFSRSLRVVTEQELAEETGFPVRETDGPLGRPDEEGTQKLVSSRLTQGEDFGATTHWSDTKIESQHGPINLKHEKNQMDFGLKGSAEGDGVFSSVTFGAREGGEKKRRIKPDKDVSVQVLRQYFSGSLKDAAKSIGVCPTTLKSICRKHGITRWPSRKIKKIDDSLKKLQFVIDSVQGTDGVIPLSSFYNSFPELSSPNLPIMISSSKSNPNYHFEQSNNQPSSSGSHSHSHSCSSSFFCSTGAMQLSLDALPPLPKRSNRVLLNGDVFRVKAAFGEKKIRFTMPQNWSFKDLQGAIVRRFNIDHEVSKIKLKYLDDDCEWIVLMSDADLKECRDIHRCSSNRIIRVSVHQMFCRNAISLVQRSVFM